MWRRPSVGRGIAASGRSRRCRGRGRGAVRTSWPGKDGDRFSSTYMGEWHDTTERSFTNMGQAAKPESWLRVTPQGLYCVPGDFHIDPHRPVARAVVTHGHADHARPGNAAVLTTPGT